MEEGKGGGKKETQKKNERTSEEKEKTKNLDQTGKKGISHIEYKGVKINEEDMKSMEGENWITITILDAFLASLEETRRDILKNNKILLIQPNIAQIFQYGDRESAQEHKKHFKTKEYDWIFYPVSKTHYPETGKLDGGIHWSLMVFSKKEHAFLHYDSIRGINELGAKKMIVNMGDEEDFNDIGHWPAFYEADCSKQDNTWACGAYLMYFMDKAIKEIGKGRGNNIGMMKPMQHEVVKTRDKLRETLEELVKKEKDIEITYENVQIGKGGWEKKQDTEKQDEIEKMEVNPPVTNIEKISESDRKKSIVDGNVADLNKDRVSKNGRINKECRFYLKGDCWRGEHCRFEHREVCEGWKVKGECGNRKCKYAHIMKCRHFYKGNCQRSNCRYLHPTGIVVVNIQQGNQPGVIDHKQQDWQGPGRTQEGNWMQDQNRNFLGTQSRVPFQNQQMRNQNVWQREHMAGNPYQNQQIRQNYGMEQGNQWNQNQNQNQNAWQREQMAANHGYPVPTEILIRAGWEKLMNQGGMWWT